MGEEKTEPNMLESGLSALIAEDEPLARFLTQSNQFSLQKRMAKPAAFMPDNKGERSVFRHGKEPRDQLWAIAGEYLKSRDPIYGAAILNAYDVRAEHLDAVPKEPPPRHANITGWPSDSDREEAKAKQKELALALVARAEVVLREDD